MNKICVIGAYGFVGRSLCSELEKSDRIIKGVVRFLDPNISSNKIKYMPVGSIGSNTEWRDILSGYDCVIHCAGKAHDMNKNSQLDAYMASNVDSTKRLAQQAAEAGVKRLIFLSSIKVNGESTDNVLNSKNKSNLNNKIFMHTDLPNPNDPYAISKFEAEKVLREISAKTNLEVVVVRLPLVYGSGVKGNLVRLIKFVKLGIPMPFSSIKNKRSMIGIDNLVDILIRCVDHPDAVGKTFLVSDGEDVSTPDLINFIASSLGGKARLFPVPIYILKLFGSILGKQKEINRLIGSLQIDSSYTKEILNWTPYLSVEEGIRRMVKGK